MNNCSNRKWLGSAASTVVLCAMVAASAHADGSVGPVCNPLVTVANNLYLADARGNVLAQFTSDGASKYDVAVSPDGKRVVYLAGPGTSVSAFQVADQGRQQGGFSVRPSARHPSGEGTPSTGANGSITGLSWDSNRVVRVAKFASKDLQRFEFYSLPDDLGAQAIQAAPAALEENCVSGEKESAPACIEREGDILLGSGPTAKNLYSVSGFEGGTPLQSLTLAAGGSAPPQNGLPFTVTVEDAGDGQVTLRLAPDTGNWSEMQIQSGSYMPEVDYHTGAVYGYFATIVGSGQVRIDVFRSDSPQYVFDPALAWVPHGEGLLFVRRTNGGVFLDLVRPGAGSGDGNSADRGKFASHDDRSDDPDGKSRWSLAAEAQLNVASTVKWMRFISPSMLLLRTSDGQVSELPIAIVHGQSGESDTLSVGSMVTLPQTIQVTLDPAAPASIAAQILDWSCETGGHGQDDDHH